MTVGINVDPDNPCAAPSAALLKQCGFEGVRLTARDTPTNKQYIADMLAAGLTVVAVVGTGDNAGYLPPDERVILNIYNEPDIQNTSLSASQYADVFANWSNKDGVRNRPRVRRWTAGLASGNVAYYRQFLQELRARHPNVPLPDAVAIHPYLLDGPGVKVRAQAYWDAAVALTGAGIPVVATEWFQSVNPDPAAVDDAIAPFQHALNDPDPVGVCTTWNSFFAWCSNQSDLPGAIVRPDGTCLPEGRRLIAAIGGDSSFCVGAPVAPPAQPAAAPTP